MNINLTNQEQVQAIQEFSEIIGFFLAYEEGATTTERANSLAKKYPVFNKIRQELLKADFDKAPESAKPAKKIKELVTE